MFGKGIFQTEEIANRKALRQKKLILSREQHKGGCGCCLVGGDSRGEVGREA